MKQGRQKLVECKDFQNTADSSGRDLKGKMTDRGVKGAWAERVCEDPSGETVDKKQGGSGGKEQELGGVAGLREEEACGPAGSTLKPQVSCSLAESPGLTLTGRTSRACWVE